MAQNPVYNNFLKEIKERIRSAQYDALKTVNKEMLYRTYDTKSLVYAPILK